MVWFQRLASVFYVFLLLRFELTESGAIFHVVSLTVFLSIIAHSTTDVAIAKRYRDER